MSHIPNIPLCYETFIQYKLDDIPHVRDRDREIKYIGGIDVN